MPGRGGHARLGAGPLAAAGLAAAVGLAAAGADVLKAFTDSEDGLAVLADLVGTG
ncbi:hypothetical protein [Kitasatospora sp. NPDC085879]|uniref:hypothetical protein n=1 Tax=Kitasatospora sp. NPDC085879 TaxID=3154769 RepID=UPI00342D2A73